MLGAKPDKTRKFNQLTYVGTMIEGINIEDVEAYHPGFAKLFKWLKTALTARKQDITRRKSMTKKAKQDRESKINASGERKINRANHLEEAENKFKDERKDEIEAFEKYQEKLAKKARQEYGDEDEDEEKANQAPPVMPVFNL